MLPLFPPASNVTMLPPLLTALHAWTTNCLDWCEPDSTKQPGGGSSGYGVVYTNRCCSWGGGVLYRSSGMRWDLRSTRSSLRTGSLPRLVRSFADIARACGVRKFELCSCTVSWGVATLCNSVLVSMMREPRVWSHSVQKEQCQGTARLSTGSRWTVLVKKPTVV